MLIVSGANALGDFGTLMSELTALKRRVDQCVRALPFTTPNDTTASLTLTCNTHISDGIRKFEKLTLLEDEDNATLFNIAQILITNWRNTDLGPKVSSTEVDVRRVAAQKLSEASVFDAVSPTLATQALSSAGRIESSNPVKLAIVRGLHTLLKTRDIPSAVRTEATTTLKILANPANHPVIDVNVLNAANDALKDLAPKLDIGPVVVTPVTKPSRVAKYKIPLIAMGITAVAATGALVLFFRREHATTLSAAGPLRRRVEAALRRRRAR